VANNEQQVPQQQPANPQAIDPTANVLEHVRLHSLRQDDLRKADSEYLRREMNLRAEHARQLAAAEKERLDAIRAIDAQSINLASSAVSQVQAAMDSKINLVAERSQQQLQGTATLIQDRLASVERQQYVNAGAKVQQVEGRQANQWALGAGLSVLGLCIAAASIVIALAQ
jgi:hypothetical protein